MKVRFELKHAELLNSSFNVPELSFIKQTEKTNSSCLPGRPIFKFEEKPN